MEYEKVPEIITGKDLDYLQDVFNWNYLAYKNTADALNFVEDNKLAKHLESALEEFCDTLDDVLGIIEGGANENSK